MTYSRQSLIRDNERVKLESLMRLLRDAVGRNLPWAAKCHAEELMKMLAEITARELDGEVERMKVGTS